VLTMEDELPTFDKFMSTNGRWYSYKGPPDADRWKRFVVRLEAVQRRLNKDCLVRTPRLRLRR